MAKEILIFAVFTALAGVLAYFTAHSQLPNSVFIAGALYGLVIAIFPRKISTQETEINEGVLFPVWQNFFAPVAVSAILFFELLDKGTIEVVQESPFLCFTAPMLLTLQIYPFLRPTRQEVLK
jgi:hypothetical protein